MTADEVYDTLAAWFASDSAGLVHVVASPSDERPFSGLYNGAPPETEPLPFCVLEPSDEARTSRSNLNEYHNEEFKFNVVTRTEEEGKSLSRQIQTAFRDKEANINALNGTQFIYLDYVRTMGPEQQALDIWLTTLEFKGQYVIPR